MIRGHNESMTWPNGGNNPPALPVPADQSWFWTKDCREREREVDDHVTAGRLSLHDSVDDLMVHLDDLSNDSA